MTSEQINAATEAMKTLVMETRPDWTSRTYKKFVRTNRAGRLFTARKCAIKLGVPSVQIDAAFTLLGIRKTSSP